MLISAGDRLSSFASIAWGPDGDEASWVTTTLIRRSRRTLRRAVCVVPAFERVVVARQLRRRMRHALGYEPNLERPRTYNEWLAWRILYDRNPLFPITIDKISVRDYVAGKVGEQVLVPVAERLAEDFDYACAARSGSGRSRIMTVAPAFRSCREGMTASWATCGARRGSIDQKRSPDSDPRHVIPPHIDTDVSRVAVGSLPKGFAFENLL